jgi:hypothetical protein
MFSMLDFGNAIINEFFLCMRCHVNFFGKFGFLNKVFGCFGNHGKLWGNCR